MTTTISTVASGSSRAMLRRLARVNRRPTRTPISA